MDLPFPQPRMGSQEIGIPSGIMGPEEVRNAQPLHTLINGISAEHRDPEPTFSNVMGCKLSKQCRADVYLRCRMNFTCDAILTKSPNFMNLGILSVYASDDLGSFTIPATIIRRTINRSKWLLPGHSIGEVTEDRMSRMQLEQKCRSKTDFETRTENQDFGRQNNSMSQPPLESTPIGTNTTNGTMSPIELIPV